MPDRHDNPHLPCVVQLGFAGSRRLFEGLPDLSPDLEKSLQEAALKHLVERLQSLLSEDLKLGRNHFLCGISQVAAGADMLFSSACRQLDLPQRVFLPQNQSDYLNATGSEDKPDFTREEKRNAEDLLAGPHVVEVRVVSDSPKRVTRFEDTNREILAHSDLIMCLLPENAASRPGGTGDVLSMARSRCIPTLEIRFSVENATACFRPQWHQLEAFKPPTLPAVLAGMPVPEIPDDRLPTVKEFCTALEKHVSSEAQRHRMRFSNAALAVIATHILATLLATLALIGHYDVHSGPHDNGLLTTIGILLLIELAVLGSGFALHLWLHERGPSKLWAMSRLLAEINRSVKALGKIHMNLGHLFSLRLPKELAHLLQTINILHLRTTKPFVNTPFRQLSDEYSKVRLVDPEGGQIAYYGKKREAEKRWLSVAHKTFIACSLGAVLATLLKLLVLSGVLPTPNGLENIAPGTLGVLAIFLPVLAVGGLSWAAAMDYEARVKTYSEMEDFLTDQVHGFNKAASVREMQLLIRETELRLLGETADWYSRRTYIGVA